jgi:Family of unknown function (DUF5681)
MSDYEVGYRKPPKHSRFKEGVSANPKGRPKRNALAAGEIAGEIINNVLNASAEYREGDRTRTAPRRELTIKTHVQRALNGDVKSAKTLLELRAQAQRFGDSPVHKIQMRDWLPDYRGQTAEQKTRELAREVEADTPGWWKRPDFDPTSEDP